ncbi:MAG: hypothetical protein DWQ05_15315 [Calditrichaeota bacterium]|nr:MAG: hypothetical protein DWQ05_15315 [Calditrichota bacterium]
MGIGGSRLKKFHSWEGTTDAKGAAAEHQSGVGLRLAEITGYPEYWAHRVLFFLFFSFFLSGFTAPFENYSGEVNEN